MALRDGRCEIAALDRNDITGLSPILFMQPYYVPHALVRIKNQAHIHILEGSVKQLIEFELEGSGTIIVEVDWPESRMERTSRGDSIVKATKSFDQALDHIKPAAQTVIAKLRSLADAPDEMEIEFGLKFAAKAGVVIASSDTEANFKVVMKWRRDTESSKG